MVDTRINIKSQNKFVGETRASSCLTELSAVNHFRKLLQQVVLSNAGVDVIIEVIVSKLVDQVLEVIHGGGGGA